jgi:DNA adenine methylase
MIPPHRIYVEVFGGSGKVLLNKPKSFLEVWNDYDRRIANLFHVVVFNFEEFYEKVRGLVYSRELYKKYKRELFEVGRVEIGDVDLAVKTYYVLCSTFGGKGNFGSGFAFGKVRNHAFTYWKLSDSLVKVKGKWLLSGYANELYDKELEGFNRYEFEAKKHSYYKKRFI